MALIEHRKDGKMITEIYAELHDGRRVGRSNITSKSEKLNIGNIVSIPVDRKSSAYPRSGKYRVTGRKTSPCGTCVVHRRVLYKETYYLMRVGDKPLVDWDN